MSGPTTGEVTGLRRQLSRAVAWNVAFTPIKFVIDIISNIIKINLLSKAEVGVLSLLSSATGTVGIWIDLGIEQALPKVIPEVERAAGPSAVRRFLNRIIAIKLLVLALALAAIPWWGEWLLARMGSQAVELAQKYGDDQVAPLIDQLARYGWLFLCAVAALLLLGALYDTLRAYLISFFHQRAWNIITVVATLLLPVLSAAAVLAGLGVLGVVAAMVVTALVSVLITWGNVGRALRRGQAGVPSAPIPGPIWWRFVPYAAMSFLLSSTDYFASPYFAVYWLQDLQVVAVFWVAYNLIKMVQSYVYTPMVGLQVPLFSRVRAEGDHRLGRVFATLARLLLLLLVPSGVLLAVFLHNFVLIQYPSYGDAIPAAMILVPFLFLEPFWGLGHNILMVHEDYRVVLLSRLAALSSVVFMATLVPRMGIVGAALAIGVGRALAGLVVIVVALRRYRLVFPWRFAGKVALASLLAAAAVAPLMFWHGLVPAGAEVGMRLRYLLANAGLGVLALAVLVVSLRRLRLLHDDDRALLSDLRHPLARWLQKLL